MRAVALDGALAVEQRRAVRLADKANQQTIRAHHRIVEDAREPDHHARLLAGEAGQRVGQRALEVGLHARGDGLEVHRRSAVVARRGQEAR